MPTENLKTQARTSTQKFPLDTGLLRSCDTDTYFRNIIFSNISEILFMSLIISNCYLWQLHNQNAELKIPYRK